MASNQTQQKNAKNMGDVEFTVEASRTVPDGEHTGEIVSAAINRRGEEGFQYLDVIVRDDESEVEIKAGYAASRITPETDLGHLLARFGAPVQPDQKVRPIQVLKAGTRVAFTTETERNKNGRFARVILDSLRPE